MYMSSIAATADHDRRPPTLSLGPAIPILLIVGALAFTLPTMAFVARESWSTEQGAHGPIVLATGLWLLHRLWPHAREVACRPDRWRVWVLLSVFLPLYVLARITQVVELEGYLMYGTLLVVLYSMIGGLSLARLWFPLFYLAFMFPPPETLVAAATTPMKMILSEAAIRFLDLFGFPIGGRGVMIYIGQYELLVAAACSGLNSVISLSAVSLFYIYIRHQANWRYALLLTVLIIPIALAANFVRVLILILLTYYAGEAAAQGFLHNFAGILMFALALMFIFILDEVLKRSWDRMAARRAASPRHPTSAEAL